MGKIRIPVLIKLMNIDLHFLLASETWGLCLQVTPVVPISADTWNMSFAKYLDLRFHCSSFRRRGSAEPCPHSLHLDHYQYFGHRDIVASFK